MAEWRSVTLSFAKAMSGCAKAMSGCAKAMSGCAKAKIDGCKNVDRC
jgi:hypothetical protein